MTKINIQLPKSKSAKPVRVRQGGGATDLQPGDELAVEIRAGQGFVILAELPSK